MKGYSPIAPIRILQQMAQYGYLSNYLLVLAHEVVEAPCAYANLAELVRLSNRTSTIILDNGVVETGTVKPDMIVEAAKLVRPDYIVLPDIMGSAAGTLRQHKVFAEEYPAHTLCRAGYMGVIQTAIPQHSVAVAHTILNEIPGVSALALPRRITNDAISVNAWGATRYVHMMHLAMDPELAGIPVHLLGMSRYLFDDVTAANFPQVIGIDSANPLAAAFEDVPLRLDGDGHVDRTRFWNDCNDLSATMCKNITYVRRLIRAFEHA